MEQNREPRNVSTRTARLIFGKVTKQLNGERITFSTNGAGFTQAKKKKKKKKKNLELNLIPHTIIYSKWIPELHVKHKSIKCLENT